MRAIAWTLLVAAAVARAGDDRLLPLPEQQGYLVEGQLNVVFQAHPDFPAAYTGHNSLRPGADAAVSFVGTLYTGVALGDRTDLLVDLEMAAGSGFSGALGVAGFPNMDVVRNPQLSAEPYLARAILHHVIPLTGRRVPAEPGPLGLASTLPAERIELRVGKLSTVDFFDQNAVASDSHLRFLNWALVNTAAYDYAADTRGYTYGAYAEWDRPELTLRFGVMVMPVVANGLQLDWDLLQDRAENLELDLRYAIGGREGVVRLLGFANHARMGLYEDALTAWRAGGAAGVPDVTTTRAPGRVKLGATVSVDQALGAGVRAFLRGGWSNGTRESFAYTEVDDTVAVGVGLDGTMWARPGDGAGLGLVSNGLAGPHRDYLAAGGLGFLLGDGALRYGREDIAEAFYTVYLGRGAYAAVDVQGIDHPGYNRDRGPVFVGSFRLHLEL